MKKIGIKFCGGCQSTYNRKELIERLTSIEGITFEYVNEDTCYDNVLVVCGCHNRCADVSKIKCRNEIIYLWNKDQEVEIRNKLEKLK